MTLARATGMRTSQMPIASLRILVAAAVLSLTAPATAGAGDFQIWGAVTLDWIKSHALTFKFETEPKVLVSKPPDNPGWAKLELTPGIEYSRGNWFDVIGDVVVARTRETDDRTTTEVTPRLGFRFHVLSNLRNDLLKEKHPTHRFVLRDLVRFEWRNLSYSDATPPSSAWRVRNRVETLMPLNRARVSDDGATYVVADAEWFWSVADQQERFANKQRVRAGIGHRYSYAWRFEALYVWDRSRDSANAGFTTADHAIDVRLQRVW